GADDGVLHAQYTAAGDIHNYLKENGVPRVGREGDQLTGNGCIEQLLRSRGTDGSPNIDIHLLSYFTRVRNNPWAPRYWIAYCPTTSLADDPLGNCPTIPTERPFAPLELPSTACHICVDRICHCFPSGSVLLPRCLHTQATYPNFTIVHWLDFDTDWCGESCLAENFQIVPQ
ncbi:MAG: hypothetical protein JWM97_2822, partial [Phycisphaerales bacterium]|nr:hypothetical protein [Phycisphaerales bacterium]